MTTCNKRIIIRPGAHIPTATQAALSFYESYIQNNSLPFGLYHQRRYVGESYSDSGLPITNVVNVYHSKNSIIVVPAEPEPEPVVGLLEPEPDTGKAAD